MGATHKLKSTIRPIFAENKHHLFRFILPFKSFNIEDSIIISSDTRSGSTWLMDLIYAMPNLVINWEPLHEKKGVIPPELKWGERPYVKEDSDDAEVKKLVEDVLSFRRRSKNSVKYCRLSDTINAKQVLTKMVRSNLLLPFIVGNFNLKHKPILLLRHPIAVSLSQLKNIPESQKELKPYEIPDTLNNERYKQNVDYLNSLNTILERQVALWCLHNMDVMNHPMTDKKWVVVYYEKLLLDTANELERISRETNLGIPIDAKRFKKPSESDFFNTFQSDTQLQLSKWLNEVSAEELVKLQKVFDHYQLTCYSASDPLPKI